MKQKPTTTTLTIDLTWAHDQEQYAPNHRHTFGRPAEFLSLEEKLGGFGKAVHDIEKNLMLNPRLTDAYDPRNMLCFDIGCFTGSKVMTSNRTYISGLSPLKTSKAGTNGIFYSAASGGLGPQIRGAGFNSIQFIGKAPRPVYMVLDDGDLYLADAKELVGKTTDEKIKILAEKYQDAAFAVIGQAGENKVRYANIAFSTTDQLKKGSRHMRFGGRGGFGAVMGSKNLLGIVIKGDKTKQDLGNVKPINKEIAKGDRTKKYREKGTFFGNIEKVEKLGVGIHDNFSRGFDAETAQLYKENLEKAGYEIKDKGCYACPVKCWKEIKKQGKILGKLDFEPGTLLGPNLGINNIEQILELINLSDDYGMDSISAGVCIGYEMEKQGKTGDFEFAKKLMHQIGRGEHGLKEGVMRYSDNAPNAMHVKGVELAAYPGNFNPGYAFAIAGPHMSMDTYNRAWYPGAENSIEEWVDNIIRGPNMMLYDMNGLCKFAKVSFEHIAELYNRIYDENITPQDLKDLAKKVNLMARKIDEKLGFAQEDDTLPEICFEDFGSEVLHFNTREFFEEVKKRVYERFKEINS